MSGLINVRALFGPEEFLAKRLMDHGLDLFDGDTDIASRRSAAREAILRLGLSAVVIGRKDGKPEDYSSYFERIYGEPLKVKP